MTNRSILTAFLFCTFAALPTLAQPGPGGGGPPDFAAMRQRMSDRIKEMLAASDDEWKVLQPKIEAIQQQKRDAGGGGGMGMMFGGFRGPGGPGGPGGPADDQPKSDVQQKLADLKTITDNKDAKPEDIKDKVAALRAAKEKAKADLQQKQTELRDIVTIRQEAVLIMIGVMD